MLGRLGLELAGRRDIRHQCQVHEDGLVRAAFGTDLADSFEERQRFDVADGAADFDQANIETFGRSVDAALDLVGDVRDHLDGAAEVVAAAFLADHFLVNAPRGDRVLASQSSMDEALVMAEVEIGLGAVVGDINLTVLERRHRARIHVEIGIEFHHGDLEAARLKDGRERRRSDALAQRGHHATGNEYQTRHGKNLPLESPILPAGGQLREFGCGLYTYASRRHTARP